MPHAQVLTIQNHYDDSSLKLERWIGEKKKSMQSPYCLCLLPLKIFSMYFLHGTAHIPPENNFKAVSFFCVRVSFS